MGKLHFVVEMYFLTVQPVLIMKKKSFHDKFTGQEILANGGLSNYYYNWQL